MLQLLLTATSLPIRRICFSSTRTSSRTLINSTCQSCIKLSKTINKNSRRPYINSPRDVVIYEHKKSTVINKLLTLCGLGQFLVTGYMSLVMYQSMPAFFSWIPVDESEERREDSKRLPLADWRYRAGFSLLTLSAATAITFTTFIFSLRSVSSITLMKNTQNVLIKTITPLGTPYHVTAPIMEISAVQQRDTSLGGSVPLKLKNERFHFLVDKEGHFPQPTLFDRTVGVNRNFGQDKSK